MHSDLYMCLLLQVLTPGVDHHCSFPNAETAADSLPRTDYCEANFELRAYTVQ